jgi:hypothetical protein
VAPTPKKPPRESTDAKELLLGFLDYYREVVAHKIDGLSNEQLRTSRLPSGWTPLELINHLIYMERRWFRWGFMAEQLPFPSGDENEEGVWHVQASVTGDDLLSELQTVGRETRSIVENADLGSAARAGGRFSMGDPLPSLAWTLIYVLQEYARHAGHLDVARELTDGAIGE